MSDNHLITSPTEHHGPLRWATGSAAVSLAALLLASFLGGFELTPARGGVQNDWIAHSPESAVFGWLGALADGDKKRARWLSEGSIATRMDRMGLEMLARETPGLTRLVAGRFWLDLTEVQYIDPAEVVLHGWVHPDPAQGPTDRVISEGEAPDCKFRLRYTRRGWRLESLQVQHAPPPGEKLHGTP